MAAGHLPAGRSSSPTAAARDPAALTDTVPCFQERTEADC